MEGFLALLHLILAGIGWYFYAIIGMISLAIGALAGGLFGALGSCFDASHREMRWVLLGALSGLVVTFYLFTNYAPHP
ncbi:hypothetical protein ACQKAJ_08120 [Helicobacter pylori]|jgi:hypothetical protein|uniref:Uncharacterized protein n=1 Tax=Myoviridae sp. ctu2j3 TaxID=2825197 RepID=A0A8S5UI99_9CAUD|nr:hypothetical protein [Enterococcus faecalis]ELG7156110.1 hypothetical protein [Staphylococcus aureus]DAF94186.1 MAG TPA: Protein of unknown function (DUF3087) [Myoviridae sp. ctu2j3]HDX9309678.1 hypothetical protein [Escherichia coli]ELL1201378.1 hypothetical protein [Staphylococcus aureus]MDN3123446.1 hypothetical protein [Enterococcus faecalis]